MQWTPDVMYEFVTTHEFKVGCPSCKLTYHHGEITFFPVLCVYPEYEDETKFNFHKVARVGIDVMIESQTCRCSLAESEFHVCRGAAKLQADETLRAFLRKRQAAVKVLPAPVEEHDLSSVEVA